MISRCLYAKYLQLSIHSARLFMYVIGYGYNGIISKPLPNKDKGLKTERERLSARYKK